ncbi:MAG TPA: MarR family transcriptional regulator [Polyangiales bacterium]|nr:MarR family transcriptional regulator [Polyangiales bacterium]
MLPAGTSALLALDNQVCFALHVATRAVQRAYQPLLGDLSLTYPQYLVMLVLWEWEQAHEPRPTLRALGERLDLDSGTLTPLLRRLEQKRLITRSRSREDGRALLIRVTRRGSSLKERAASVPMQMIASSPFSLEELVSLREQLKRLRTGLVAQESTHETV